MTQKVDSIANSKFELHASENYEKFKTSVLEGMSD
jgi:hypothetical protein